MNSAVEAVLREVLTSASIDRAAADAQMAWVRLQFGLSTRWSLGEDVVGIAHQVALLSSDIPPSLDEIPLDLRMRLESLAGCMDIAARVTDDRAREFAKLAATIYIVAQQPTRAARVARRLRAAQGVEPPLVGLYRILQTAYRMNGARTVSSVTDAVSRETFGETGHAFADALSATSWEPAIFRLLRETEVALRYRQEHDLRQVADGFLPPTYVEHAYDGPNWSRRNELLPSQVSVIRNGYLRSQRCLVSTPTGTGKTFLAELRIASELRSNPFGLVVYIAPLNALARQVYRDFERRLSTVARITLWTGAYEIDESVSNLGNVLVTTPEKLDSILRLNLADDLRSADLLQRLCLVIADEAHQVSDGSRGVLYEFLLLRLKRRLPNLDLVAMSAVQSDAAPYARFLRSNSESADVHQVDWSATSIWDLLWTKTGELRARRELGPAPRVARPKQAKAAAALAVATLLERSESVLLVETRRDWAEALADEIFKQYRDYLDERLARNARDHASTEELESFAREIAERLYPSHPLIQYVRCGLAVHHAGLPPSIRRRVEELTRRELIHTVVSTTTLAEGIDLPFRVVVLCRLALPFGQPIRAARLRNIRGRAARPGYASDGIFLILEPENVDTATYQYFLDHYWDESVETAESPSALTDLFSTEPIRQQPALRSLQSQLLAFFAENSVELSDAGSIASETLFAEASEQESFLVSRLAAGIQRTTEAMLQSPPLLKVASPVSPTTFGRAAILGGLSASSALLIRDALLANLPELQGILDESGERELAVRLAWLPWEAVETTEEYRNALSQRRPFPRSVDRLPSLLDRRLTTQYEMTRLLLSQRLLQDLADGEAETVRGRTADDRLARLVEWGGRTSAVLPWTLTGVLRVAEALVGESPDVAVVSAVASPYVQFLSAWVPSQGGAELVRRGILDRDAALRILEVSDLWDSPADDLISWARVHEAEAVALIGNREYRSLLRNLPDDIAPDDIVEDETE
jgi:hypothetical protein